MTGVLGGRASRAVYGTCRRPAGGDPVPVGVTNGCREPGIVAAPPGWYRNNPVIHLPAVWVLVGIAARRSPVCSTVHCCKAVHRATGDQIDETFSHRPRYGRFRSGVDPWLYWGVNCPATRASGGRPLLPDLDDVSQAVVHFSWLPQQRSFVCWVRLSPRAGGP